MKLRIDVINILYTRFRTNTNDSNRSQINTVFDHQSPKYKSFRFCIKYNINHNNFNNLKLFKKHSNNVLTQYIFFFLNFHCFYSVWSIIMYMSLN